LGTDPFQREWQTDGLGDCYALRFHAHGAIGDDPGRLGPCGLILGVSRTSGMEIAQFLFDSFA
jgi:hypothetical protein